MSFSFSRLFDAVFGWLIPDPPPYQGGAELTIAKPAYEPIVYGHVTNVEGVIVASHIVNPPDGDDIPNDILYVQVVWSVGYIQEVMQIYLDDEPIDSTKFDASNGRWVQHLNVTNGDDKSFTMDGVAGSVDFKSKGYSYSVIRLEYDPEKMNKLPKITADLLGLKVTPVGGGAKVYSDNYADILNDYLTNPDYGRGLDSSRINQASLVSEEAFSSSLVYPYADSPSYQPLISCNLRLDGNNTILNNINKILKGCRGILPFIDGEFHFLIERDRTALVGFEIDDTNRMSDFIVEDIEIKDYYNKVTVRFKDRAQKGKLGNAVYPVDDTEYQTYLTVDGDIPYEKTVTVDTINNMYEALQMAEIILKRSRNALKVKVSVKSEAKVVGVGQVINVSNVAFGMVQKPFIAMNKKTKASGIVELELIEYQGSIYPWGEKDEQIIPDTTVVDYTVVTVPTNLTISIPTDGTSQAVITWDSPHNSFFIDMDGDVSNTGNKFYPLVNLPFGERTFKVKAINGLGYSSGFASLVFDIVVPQTPTLTLVVGTFDVEVTPSITGSYLGVTFELLIGITNVENDAVNKGKSGTFTLTGLVPETDYYVWVRTVNIAGVSAWTTDTFTTLDGAEIIAVVGDLSLIEFDEIKVDVAELETNVAELELETESLLEDVIWNTVLHQEKVTELGVNTADISYNEEAIVTETTARVSQGTLLQASVDAHGIVIDGEIERVDLISLDVDGNNTAISTLEGTVNNVTSGVTATYGLTLTAQTTADGAATVSNTLSNQVNNVTTGLSATNTIAQNATTTADGAATAVTTINASIDDIENMTGTASTLSLSVDKNTAAFSLEANVDGKIVGVKAGIDANGSILDFMGDQVRFLKADGVTPAIYFNTVDGKYYFDGDLIAAGGNFSGTVTIGGTNLTQTNTLNSNTTYAELDGTKPPTNANFVNNTNQLTDGSGLGNTAQWNNVANTSNAPDDNATANQSDSTTNNAIGNAALTAQWNNVSGTGKPANYATANSTDAQIRAIAAATSGSVGGWTIESNYIYSGTKQTTDGAFAAVGSITLSNTGAIRANQFRIDNNGSAHFKGDISGASGEFSGTMKISTVFEIDAAGVLRADDAIFDNVGAKVILATTNSGAPTGSFTNAGTGRAVYGNGSGTGDGVYGIGDVGVRANSRLGVSAFYADNGGYSPFTGSHEGLIPINQPEIIQGDIVCDVSVINIQNISNAICEMELSTTVNQKSARGIFVRQVDLVVEDVAGLDNDVETAQLSLVYDLIGFNSLGEGAMNVCGEGGDIEIGDLIVTSSIAGKGMKQSDDILRNYTVAESRQNVTFSSATEIKQIACIYRCG